MGIYCCRRLSELLIKGIRADGSTGCGVFVVTVVEVIKETIWYRCGGALCAPRTIQWRPVHESSYITPHPHASVDNFSFQNILPIYKSHSYTGCMIFYLCLNK
jgi:hypothetical protein